MPALQRDSLYKKYNDSFKIGTAIDYNRCQEYHDIISKHFNSITPENEMKFEHIHPEEKKYFWENMDNLCKYAAHNMCSVRGHTLLWHEQLPKWVKEHEGDTLYLKRILCDHVSTIVDRYKNNVDSWDVVNEIFSDDGSETFRKTLWFESMGESFVEHAFCAAKEADPNGSFFINEYNGHIPLKREKILACIDMMKKRGVPIDGIGIQGHYNIFFPSLEMIRSEIEEYVGRGLKIQVTELDISVFDFFDTRVDLLYPTEDMIKRQEEMYYKLFSLYEEFKDYISSITLWGVADNHTWLDSYPVEGRKDWPLLFDENLQGKRILWSLLGEKDDITD